jgi:hypothetical protein
MFHKGSGSVQPRSSECGWYETEDGERVEL